MRPRGLSRCQAVVSELEENMTLLYCPIAMVAMGLPMGTSKQSFHGVLMILHSPLRLEFMGAKYYSPKVDISAQSLPRVPNQIAFIDQLGNSPQQAYKEICGDSSGDYMGSRSQTEFHTSTQPFSWHS